MIQRLFIKKNRVSLYSLCVFAGQFLITFQIYGNKVTEKLQEKTPEIYEKLNQKIDLNLQFTNQDGKKETLKSLFKNEKVLIVSLNYYKCTTMCSFQFVNLASALKKMDWPIGNGFRIATFSFDPKDTVAIAKEKQTLWIPKTGQNHAKWDFFVGDQKNIDALTKEFNFFYELDPATGEYSHAAALFFIKPDGTFYRYLYGFLYEPQDLKHALIDSSDGKIGSFFEKLIVKFKKYQSETGKYVSLLK